MKTGSLGIYCLANDRVSDWLVALLNSLRAHGCALPVRVIPFDDNLAKTRELSARYGFEIIAHPELEAMDRLGREFYPSLVAAAHTFRKLAAFSGEFDHFLFIDSDVVALDNLQALIDAYLNGDVDVLHTDYDPSKRYGRDLFAPRLVPLYPETGVCTGFFFAARGLLSPAFIRECADAAAEDPYCLRLKFEEPFINYCFYRRAANVRLHAGLIPGIAPSTWAGAESIRPCGNPEDYREEASRPGWLPLVHWAGYGIDWSMPHRELFLHYRLQGCSFAEKQRYRAGLMARSAASQLKSGLRSRARAVKHRLLPARQAGQSA